MDHDDENAHVEGTRAYDDENAYLEGARAHDEKAYGESVEAYLNAIGRLYGQTDRGMLVTLGERGEGAIDVGPGFEERVEEVIGRSREVGQQLVGRIRRQGRVAGVRVLRDRWEQRELAELQLSGAVAMDMEVANDLARIVGEDLERAADEKGMRGFTLAVTRRYPAMLPVAFADLEKVLTTDPSSGMGRLLTLRVQPSIAGPSNPIEARTALEDAVERTLVQICGDTTSIGVQAAGNLLPAVPIENEVVKKAVNIASGAAELLSPLFKGVTLPSNPLAAWVTRQAIRMVNEGFEKVRQLFGLRDRRTVYDVVPDWMSELQRPKPLEWLTGQLYGVEDIKGECRRQIEAASTASPDPFNNARRDVIELADGFRERKGILSWVTTVVHFAGKWLIPLSPPWGPIGYVAGNVAVFGYVVYLGADYCDSQRGWAQALNFVPGVPAIVDKYLPHPQPALP